MSGQSSQRPPRQPTFAEAGKALVLAMAEEVEKVFDTTRNMGQQWNYPVPGQRGFYMILWAQALPGKTEHVDMRLKSVKTELIKLAEKGPNNIEGIKNCIWKFEQMRMPCGPGRPAEPNVNPDDDDLDVEDPDGPPIGEVTLTNGGLYAKSLRELRVTKRQKLA